MGQVVAVTGWVVAAFLAGVLAPRPAVTLVDPRYPPAIAGSGWEYHETLAADLDGDGGVETVSVIARASRVGNTFDFDDGQPWQVYVEEADGQRTYLYSRWVQNGRLEVYDSPDGGTTSLVILEQQSLSLALYRVFYDGPGNWRSQWIGAAGTNQRTRRP